LTTYKLVFDGSAEKEFRKLGATIKQQFKKKLGERLLHPHIAADRLYGFENCYKIKLRSVGYRLIYQVREETISVIVISVGKRDSGKDDAYSAAKRRI
jgi:mRNA interferase RelE/StbE